MNGWENLASLSVFRWDDTRQPNSPLCAGSHVNVTSTKFVLEWVPLSHCQPILLRPGFLYALGLGASLHTPYKKVFLFLCIFSRQHEHQVMESFRDVHNTTADLVASSLRHAMLRVVCY